MGEQVLGRQTTMHAPMPQRTNTVHQTPHRRGAETDHPDTVEHELALGADAPNERYAPHPGDALAAEMRGRRLGDFIKGRRKYLDLSQAGVAERLRICTRTYGNWERGQLKEWTESKLYDLAEVLQMSEYQTAKLFWLALERIPQPDARTRPMSMQRQDTSAASLLEAYGVMMDALSLPTFLVDHRWDVRMSNHAYRSLFRNLAQHPTMMPSGNFLRFGLFHPEAATIFADHPKWQLAMLATLASGLERHSEDAVLQTIRRDVYRHPGLRDTYLKQLPAWVVGSGSDLVHEETVRELRHPDPQVGLQGCRLVEEAPRSLQAFRLTRITFVPVEPDDRLMPTWQETHSHRAA